MGVAPPRRDLEHVSDVLAMIRRGYTRLDRAEGMGFPAHTCGPLSTPERRHPGWLPVIRNPWALGIAGENVGEPRRGRRGPQPSEAGR